MTVLVVGATGQQGGATARELLASGVPVRALVRDPDSDRARALARSGAELRTGDLHDRDSLAEAADGARAVFSVQMPAFTDGFPDFDGELTQALNLIETAKAAGVAQFVHTSVSGAGRHTQAPGWDEGRWASMAAVYKPKTGAETAVREAGFPQWTLLKPGFFMENLLPATAYLFPRGVEGGLATVLKPATHLSLVAVQDIGRAAAAAFRAPDRFHRVELELASDYLTMAEIAAVLTDALGTEVTAPDMAEEQALAAGMPPYAAVSHAFLQAAGQPARPDFARALGIPLTSFREWAHARLGIQ
ncbi:NmrA family NAD(P)-binding protein [Catenuloplanes japonicus]|uniref:NmrA family NAD(P)-binding protein n=1 Tax=Catenuloplanes japonicus TaxID=33876 RepID=UPI000525B5CA|nr:NmrA family NAD(P)-binding protein [Catenuloplanes japonicus]